MWSAMTRKATSTFSCSLRFCAEAGSVDCVFLAGDFFEFVEEGAEDVGLVVGDFGVLEIGEAFRALDHRGDALEAHAGVDVLGGEIDEGAVGVGVELDEDEVPDFDAARVALVDEVAAGDLARDVEVARAGREVDVEFAARAARAGVAHHPEVVLFVAVDDVVGGVEAGCDEDFRPVLVRLAVEAGGVAGAGRVDGGVDARGGKLPALDDEFPRPFDGFLLEVIAEGPVAEHLEKSVVIGVEADVLEVVVLAAGADALLRVGGARGRVGARRLAEEDGHELVHARVGEEQIGRVGQQRAGGNDGVLLFLEEIEEGLADVGGGHGWREFGEFDGITELTKLTELGRRGNSFRVDGIGSVARSLARSATFPPITRILLKQ